MADGLINVEVAYATPERQVIIAVTLPAGGTAEQAIQASGILRQFAEIDLSRQKIGIFASVCRLDQMLADGDRVEIYRPLQQNPMDARRGRVQR